MSPETALLKLSKTQTRVGALGKCGIQRILVVPQLLVLQRTHVQDLCNLQEAPCFNQHHVVVGDKLILSTARHALPSFSA